MTLSMIWVDVETTGLDPSRDALLEVAAFLTAPDEVKRLVPGKVKRLVVRVLPWVSTVTPGLTIDPVVRDMHERSGLWRECAEAFVSRVGPRTALEDLDDELAALVLETTDPEERPVLAGSMVHFDRAFLRRYLPRFEGRLSYRNYDVTAVKLFCRSLGMPKIPKGEAHRAEADVLESVAHLCLCTVWLREHFRSFDEAALPAMKALSWTDNDGDMWGRGWNSAVRRTREALGLSVVADPKETEETKEETKEERGAKS